ncbi:MAG TPA: serine--tRNA ligase [Planctomycetota bacterium]|nr:serine--tRNA ligase [Planctomycetota bacterium]
MLDIAFIRDDPERVRRGAARKRIEFDVDRVLALDVERRRRLQVRENAKAEQNRLGKQVATLAGASKQEALARLKSLKEEVAAADAGVAPVEKELADLMRFAPNPPADDVPDGATDADNVEVRRHGEPPRFEGPPKDHVDLMTARGWLDIDRAGRLGGSRSYILKGEAVLLEQAVLRLGLDLIVARGFTPMSVPVLVREDALTGTAYFPGAEEQTYRIQNPTFEDQAAWLVGTSEVSVTAYRAGEILDLAELPLRYAGISPCFRREAGTYGKDARGLYRVHQFNKVEQVVVDVADETRSRAHLEDIVANAEALLRALEVPYRVVAVCAGDMGRGQVFKYDLEAWMPGRKGYGETHSASMFFDFQARRLDLRYRDAEGRVRHCHTLNNTVVATPRILIAVLENHQRPDGTVGVPAALRPYLGGRETI